MSLEDKLYPLLKYYEAAPQSVKSAVGHAYRLLPHRLRYGADYARFQQEAAEVRHWSQGQIEAYQIQAVRDSLIAASMAPHYREKFQSLGLSPESFTSLGQLQEYPLLAKQDIILHREDLVNSRISQGQRLYHTTGGSSGVPVGFYLQKGVSRPKEQAYLEAQWARRGWRTGDRTAVIRGMVTSSTAGGSISSYDATRNWLILSSYHFTEERAPEYLAALRKFQPAHLHAYPSIALMLARWLEAKKLRLGFPLTSILCGSEKLSPEAQSYLEEVFETRVFHWYGHSERVVLAGQGETSNHLYFWPTYGYVEFGQENDQGQREIIGTSFHNHAMPLIRYRTGDYVMASQVQNREYPWVEIEGVVGRGYEFLISSTGRKVSLTAMNMHDDSFDGLLAVQFVQHEPGVAEFRYQAGPEWKSDQVGNINKALQRKLGDDFTFHLTPVTEVERTAAGKHKWLITSLKQGADHAV